MIIQLVLAAVLPLTCGANAHLRAKIAGIRFDPREFGCDSLRKSDSFLETPIAPIGENGQAAWNARARWFIYAPTFGFTNSNKAVSYRFTVTDDKDVVRIFTAKKATAALSPVWNELPTGYVVVKAEGLDEKGEVVSFAGSRRFWKAEPFDAAKCPAAKRSYAEAAKAICDYIVSQPHMKHLEKTGEIDMSYALNGYPSKMFSAQIVALIKCGKTELAKRLADRLIARSEPAGAPLEFFTLTYDGGGHKDVSKKYADLIMLKYPAVAGLALLDVAEATGEPKYREHAVKVADTYLKLQGDDGTWFLKLNRKTGKAANPNRLVPTEDVVPFLERVSKITGEQKYREAAERAVAFVENGSVRTWNWDAQFEDVEPKEPYLNLTEHGVASYAIYLAERYPNDRAKLALARELVRFCEDQFICWSEPYAGHELPPGETRDNWATCFQDWVYPCSLEQYGYYVPIDASAAKMIRAYLALYRVTDNLEDLAKARALGNVMTQTQSANGRLRTWWRKPVDRADNGDDWDNCMIASAEALEELAKFDVEELRSKACK